MFPGVKRSLLNQRIVRGSVTAREREVFFVVPSSQPKDSSQRVSCTHQGGTHGSHVRGACAQQLPMLARGVSSSSPTAQHCLTFQSTQEITLIVATRGAISINLQQNCVPDRNFPFLLYCVAMDSIVPLNRTQEDRGQKRPRKENGKRQKVQNQKEAVAQLLLAKQVLKYALEIRELQTCVIQVSHRQRHGSLDQVSLRRVRSPLLECFQRGAAEHRAAAWIDLA